MNNHPISFWLSDVPQPDIYVAFRSEFLITKSKAFRLRHCGSSWYRIWLDGEWLDEGPCRFHPENAEYQEPAFMLKQGRHCLAVLCHNIGYPTRMLLDQVPFFFADLRDNQGTKVALKWTGRQMNAYDSQVRRISPQLGWMEWCDIGQLPKGWKLSGFEAHWSEVTESEGAAQPKRAVDLPQIERHSIIPTLIGMGRLQNRFFYEKDDPTLSFSLRALNPESEGDGSWWRYDLGQVRLGCPELVINAQAGDRFEIGWSEMLYDGRVIPAINASLGQSANLDHYILGDGTQIIEPLTPRGGRFLELHHIGQTPAQLELRFHERSLYNPNLSTAFQCDDPLLQRIWQTGVDTLRACAEDAIIDNPTRERGQWLGDVANVGLKVAAACGGDLRVFARGLRQAVKCANADGVVAALFPGQRAHLSSFALNWVDACLEYFQLTNDRDLLDNLFPAAQKNLSSIEQFFENSFTPNVRHQMWDFIDWGYPSHLKDGRNFALYFHFVSAFEALKRWSEILHRENEIETLRDRQDGRTFRFNEQLKLLGGVHSLRFHECVLGLRAGLFLPEEKEVLLDRCESYIRSCFPMDPDAPDIGVFTIDMQASPVPFLSNPNTITPYFLHFALPLFFESGRGEFALEVIRNCWGWCLSQGLTTWPEFFSLRGSHCHQWSACPTWLLSRYLSAQN